MASHAGVSCGARLVDARGVTTPRASTRDARRRLYADAMAIIAGEYPTDLRLDEVAARIFTSRRALQRAFRDAGSSFGAAHVRTRLQAAAALMYADPGLTVHDVAHAVGYHQPSQFAKAFKRQFAVSPTQFKTIEHQGR